MIFNDGVAVTLLQTLSNVMPNRTNTTWLCRRHTRALMGVPKWLRTTVDTGGEVGSTPTPRGGVGRANQQAVSADNGVQTSQKFIRADAECVCHARAGKGLVVMVSNCRALAFVAGTARRP